MLQTDTPPALPCSTYWGRQGSVGVVLRVLGVFRMTNEHWHQLILTSYMSSYKRPSLSLEALKEETSSLQPRKPYRHLSPSSFKRRLFLPHLKSAVEFSHHHPISGLGWVIDWPSISACFLTCTFTPWRNHPLPTWTRLGQLWHLFYSFSTHLCLHEVDEREGSSLG